MSAFFFRNVQLGVCLNLGFLTLASATFIQEDFSGATLNSSIWGATNTSGAAAPSQAGGGLTTSVTTSGQNQRSLIYSVATDFDFTVQPLTLSANISSLGGVGALSQPVNRYLLIGSFGTNTETLSRYYPGSELRFGVWLSAGQTNGVNYLEVGTVRIGNITTTRQIYSGDLTAMSLTLNGTAYSVSASGTGGFSVGTGNSFNGTLANVIASEYDGDFRFAMGAANSYQGTVTTGASAVWDSVSVVPEPGTLALLAIGAGGLIASRRRLRHSRCA